MYDETTFLSPSENEHFFGSIPEAAIEMALERIRTGKITPNDISKCLEGLRSNRYNIDLLSLEYSNEYNSFVAPFTFAPETALEQVHDCFVTLRLPVAFVTKQGRVLGMRQ